MASRAPASRFLAVSFIENRTRRQRVILTAIVGAVVAWLFLRKVAGVVLDRWWFESVTTADVWRTRVVTQLELLVGAGALAAVVLGTSVWLVLRLAQLQANSPNRVFQRYHERMGPAHRWLLVGIVVFFAVRIALAATQQWQSFLLFRNAVDLGTTAPVAGSDLGYHLFRLPFLTELGDHLRQLLLFTIAVSAFGHLASGALRMPRNETRPSRVAIAHLAMLTAGFLAVQALYDIFVARPSIATSRAGAFDGPGWTELHITRPGLIVASLATIAAGFAAVWLARTGNWRPLAITLTVAAVVQILVIAVLPALSERFVVAPAEAERQLWSIQSNLDATQLAYDLNEVSERPLAETDGATSADLADVERVQIFETASMTNALQVLAGTTATRITETDVDRYDVDDDTEPVFIAARSANQADVPESGWVQEHLVYTHGDGVVIVPSDRTDNDGRPDTSAFPDAFGAATTPLYFGESLDSWYAIVGTKREQVGDTTFTGEGIDVSSFAERLTASLALGDPQILLSNELTAESQLLYQRSLTERVGNLAPFLSLDSDPYPVVVDDGTVLWVIDGYTTSATFPYSQFASPSDLSSSSGLSGQSFNALSASVKATVDAATGETHLYRTDNGGDPIIDAWDRIFPGLLEDEASIPDTLRDHLRYPTDLWTVQTSLLGRYHVDSAEELFSGTERWAVSAAPAATVGDTTDSPSPAVDLFTPLASSPDRFGSVRPYGPGSAANPTSTRNELAALAVADHDLDEGIHIATTTGAMPPLLSPQVAQSAIDANPEVARAITLLNANGSKVQFGPMSPVLADGQLVWVRPIVVIGTGTSAVPRLYGVAAVANGVVAVEQTTVEAVTSALS